MGTRDQRGSDQGGITAVIMTKRIMQTRKPTGLHSKVIAALKPGD